MHETDAEDTLRRLAVVDWPALARRLRGEVILDGDERMVLAGKQFAAGRPLAFPRALVRCHDEDDVRSALEFVRTRRIPFSIRSGGHCFGDLSSHSGAILDLGGMDRIQADGEGRVRIGPGAYAADVGRALVTQGRMLPTGGCPWVALGGLSLAGGFGFLGRRHGLTTDQVEAVRVVTADGDMRIAGVNDAPDLFWALRGGGTAGFGIVTQLTLRTHPLAELTVCHGVWPMREAAGLIERWQQWAPGASGDINLELGLMGPDEPELDSRIELYGVVLGDAAAARAPLADLRRWLGPLAGALSTWRLRDQAATDYLVGLLDRRTEPAWQPSRPYRQIGYQFTRSDFFEAGLDGDAIRECVERFAADRRYAQFRELEFVPWGGAYAQDNPSACFFHRRPRLLVRHTVMLGSRATPELREHARHWVDASQQTLQRHADGHAYQGYADLRREDWARVYYGDAYPRLQSVKRRYDPQQVFRHAQSVVPD